MTFRFKPEDFSAFELDTSRDDIAEVANRWLDEYTTTLPIVFGQVPVGEQDMYWATHLISTDTHTARLWGVEEIKPKECQHALLISDDDIESNFTSDDKCAHCRKKIKLKWEVVE